MGYLIVSFASQPAMAAIMGPPTAFPANNKREKDIRIEKGGSGEKSMAYQHSFFNDTMSVYAP